MDEITPLMDWAHALAGDPALDGVDYASLALVVLPDAADPVVYGFWYSATGAATVWAPADPAVHLGHARAVRTAMCAGGRRPWAGVVLRLTVPHVTLDALWLRGDQAARWDVPDGKRAALATSARP